MDRFLADNKIAWESIAPIHSKGLEAKRQQIVTDKEYIPISNVVEEYLDAVGVEGKSCLHLCCNNGFETIGLKRKGASTCVGVDFCEYNINFANRLAEELGLDDSVTFVQSDVAASELPELIDQTFDVVYLSTGSLCWIENLSELYRNIACLLKPDGKVFIFDLHPMSNIINDNKYPDMNALLVVRPYFTATPWTHHASLDYVSRSHPQKQTYHMFSHTFSAILQKALDERLRLEFVEESEIDEAGGFLRVISKEIHFPLSFCVVFSRSE